MLGGNLGSLLYGDVSVMLISNINVTDGAIGRTLNGIGIPMIPAVKPRTSALLISQIHPNTLDLYVKFLCSVASFFYHFIYY